jgi:hypothetical protein
MTTICAPARFDPTRIADSPLSYPTSLKDFQKQVKDLNAKVDFILANAEEMSPQRIRSSIELLRREISRTQRSIDTAVSPEIPKYKIDNARGDVRVAKELMEALLASLYPPGAELRVI